MLLKHRKEGRRYLFWFARVEAELPGKDNSFHLNEVLGKLLIKYVEKINAKHSQEKRG
jgi:hypothetical protein